MTHYFGRLRSLLQRPPSAALWQRLCDVLSDWPDPDELEQVIIPYTRGVLSQWDARIPRELPRRKRAYGEWITLTTRAHKPTLVVLHEGLVSLANAATIEGEDALTAWLHSEQLEQLRHLRLISCGLGYSGLPQLAMRLRQGQLLSLSIEDDLGSGAQELAKHVELLGSLERLELQRPARIHPLHLDALLGSDALGGLKTLVLRRWTLARGELELIGASLPSLARLELHELNATANDLNALLSSPHLNALEHLTLMEVKLDEHSLAAMSENPSLRRLRTLHLLAHRTTHQPSTLFEEASNLTSLEELRLQLSFDPKALRIAHPSRLKHLSLNAIELDEATLALLLNAQLESLALEHCNISSPSFLAQLSAPEARSLKHLSTTECAIAPQQLPPEHYPGGALETLKISSARTYTPNITAPHGARGPYGFRFTIDDQLIDQLIDSGLTTRLKHLALYQGMLTTASVQRIAEDERFGALEHLELHRQKLDERTLGILLNSDTLRALHTLDLAENQLGDPDPGIIYLAHARLKHLNLSNNHISEEGFALIARCPALRDLETLSIDPHRLNTEAARPLAQSTQLPQDLIIKLTDATIASHNDEPLIARFGPGCVQEHLEPWS